MKNKACLGDRKVEVPSLTDIMIFNGDPEMCLLTLGMLRIIKMVPEKHRKDAQLELSHVTQKQPAIGICGRTSKT